MKKKSVALLLATTMCFGAAVGGTLAWLTDTADEVTNTFTIGDINIELDEAVDTDNNKTHSYDFVPGDVLTKDPKVTVKADSEACYLFVKVTETNNTHEDLSGDIINWAVRTGEWTSYTPTTAVENGTYYYYKTVEAVTEDTSIYILTGDTNNVNGMVTVNQNITKAMRDDIYAAAPQLIFEAAAVQMDNIADVNAAWEALDSEFKN